MEINWTQILGLIVFPFVVVMVTVAILYNKLGRNIPKHKKR